MFVTLTAKLQNGATKLKSKFRQAKKKKKRWRTAREAYYSKFEIVQDNFVFFFLNAKQKEDLKLNTEIIFKYLIFELNIQKKKLKVIIRELFAA